MANSASVENARELMRFLNAQVQAARDNRNLSVQGRQTEIARAYSATAPKIRALEAADKAAKAKEREDLERSLFTSNTGDTASIIQGRDAFERAARITDHREASALLSQARLNGDVQLAKAILHRSTTMGYQGVVGEFTEAFPEYADRVQALYTAQPFDGFMSALNYHVNRPQELGTLSDYEIEQVATGADSTRAAMARGTSGTGVITT